MKLNMVAFIGNNEIRYSDIKGKLDAVRELYPHAMWISNGTAGTALIAARYAKLNKIPLCMHLPFPPEIMSYSCAKGWRNILFEALEYAQRVSIGSDAFSFEGYQKCNKRIIDNADVVVTFNRLIDTNDTFYAKSAGKLVLDGFSLSTQNIARTYAGLWNLPITRVVTHTGAGEEGVYSESIIGI